MTLSRRRVLTIMAAAGGTALTGRAAAARTEWTGRAMGAEAHLVLTGPESMREAVLADLETTLAHIEAQFSLYTPSALTQLNETGVLMRPHEDFHQVLALSDRLHHATGGLFDPTVQPLWRALAQGHDIATARWTLGWDRVQHGPEIVRLAKGQALTLNGIAQGFATDAVVEVLKRHGMEQGLVEIGEIAARGGPWTIGVADPEHGVVLSRRLTDGAIATSSPYAMRLGAHGHILSPHGNAPIWSTLSVEAESAAVADGLSTALCFLSAQDLARIAPALRAEFALRRITAVSADGDFRTF